MTEHRWHRPSFPSLNYTKWVSSHPAGGAYSAPPDPLAGLRGRKGDKEGGELGKERSGRGERGKGRREGERKGKGRDPTKFREKLTPLAGWAKTECVRVCVVINVCVICRRMVFATTAVLSPISEHPHCESASCFRQRQKWSAAK